MAGWQRNHATKSRNDTRNAAPHNAHRPRTTRRPRRRRSPPRRAPSGCRLAPPAAHRPRLAAAPPAQGPAGQRASGRRAPHPCMGGGGGGPVLGWGGRGIGPFGGGGPTPEGGGGRALDEPLGVHLPAGSGANGDFRASPPDCRGEKGRVVKVAKFLSSITYEFLDDWLLLLDLFLVFTRRSFPSLTVTQDFFNTIIQVILRD